MSIEAPGLRKLLLVCVGPRDGDGAPRGDSDARRVMDCVRNTWEWVEAVVASSDPVALAAATRLGHAVVLETAFAAQHSSRRAPESRDALAARVAAGLRRIEASRANGALVVADAPVWGAIWSSLIGVDPPAGRPRWGDVGLLARGPDGRWFPGRHCSDPPALRSPLEREGIAGAEELIADGVQHAASLEIAAPASRA